MAEIVATAEKTAIDAVSSVKVIPSFLVIGPSKTKDTVNAAMIRMEISKTLKF